MTFFVKEVKVEFHIYCPQELELIISDKQSKYLTECVRLERQWCPMVRDESALREPGTPKHFLRNAQTDAKQVYNSLNGQKNPPQLCLRTQWDSVNFSPSGIKRNSFDEQKQKNPILRGSSVQSLSSGVVLEVSVCSYHVAKTSGVRHFHLN